jgi:hypothetical protein
MPPGYWHEVYTPTHSICRGGHFFSLETMHLTEMSWRVDRKRGSTADNYAGVLRSLCRIALALPRWREQSRCRRPFLRPFGCLSACLEVLKWPVLALARMLIKEKEYRPARSEGLNSPQGECLRGRELMELEGAIGLVRSIMLAACVPDSGLDEERDKWTARFPDPGEEMIDLSSIREC